MWTSSAKTTELPPPPTQDWRGSGAAGPLLLRKGKAEAEAGNRTDLCPVLPVMEYLRARLGGIDSSIRSFVGLQHLFGSTASLIESIAGGRIAPGNVSLLGKPYSTNRRVMSFLQEDLGYWVHPASCVQPRDRSSDWDMDRKIETVLNNLRQILERQRKCDRGQILLIDDGGRAIHMLHSERYDDIRSRFTCVEQTRCGIRNIENLDLRVPVINVAESWVKLEHESPLIAESVIHELTDQLAVMKSAGIDTGDRAVVIGYGAIGRAISAELRRNACEVVVYDRETTKRHEAADDGFDVHRDLHRALGSGGAIIGCTGLPVLDTLDYAYIPDGAVLISASSADVEFRAWQLRTAGRCLGSPQAWNPREEGRDLRTAVIDDPRHGHPCFSLFRIANGNGRFYLVNGGFPVNFNGGIDPIPPAKIQLTRSLLYLGAYQAALTSVPGLHALDDSHQHTLLQAYESAGSLQAA